MSEKPERRSVTVRIAGEEHTIRAAAEAEYTERCARYVDERITEIRRRAGVLESDRAAILAALSITDECFQAREELERLRKELHSRATNLERRVEGALARDDADTEPTDAGAGPVDPAADPDQPGSGAGAEPTDDAEASPPAAED